jgi:broad specificity phosphatase PhoE
MEGKTGKLEDINSSEMNEGTKSTTETNDYHPKHFIVLVRHGERSDDPERDVDSLNDYAEPEVKFDWHLTDKGRKQAFKTGEYLKSSVFDQNGLKLKSSDIKVFTSPFLRCIQTASEICKGIEHSIQEIIIDDRLGEFLMKSWFDGVEKPLAHLTINHVKQSKFQQKYLGKENLYKLTRLYGKDATPTAEDVNVFEDDECGVTSMESNSTIKYPETYSDMFYRYSNFINEVIYQEFFEKPEVVSNRSKVVILVSHGFSFDPFINCFSPDHAQIVSVDYCAVWISEKLSNDERFELVTKGDATHCGLNPALF